MSQAKQTKPSSEKEKQKTQEQVIEGFNHLRQEQKVIITKITDLEQELNEHNLVIETLMKVDEGRKCYRMIGGVLVQRTVKEVLPAVSMNKEKLAEIIEYLYRQAETKGREINEYKEKYDIQIRREPSILAPTPAASGDQPSSSGVLVDSKS